MNIEKKLKQLRRAKKLRPLLLYHFARLHGIHGVDVPEDQFQRVQAFVKALFKAAKREGYDIRINHWGAIYLIDPERQIPVAFSVNTPVATSQVNDLEQRLKETPYIALDASLIRSNQLNVGFRAWRPGTKWHYRDMEDQENDAILVEELIADIRTRLSGLVASVRHTLPTNLDEVTVDDVLSVLTYSYVKMNGTDQLPPWEREHHRWEIQGYVIESDRLSFDVRFSTLEYRLKKPDIQLLKRILPNIEEERVEVRSNHY